MFRKAMAITPGTDESPMSVKSENSYGKRQGLKLDSELGRLRNSGDSVSMSAPNTPGSKRALMPRYCVFVHLLCKYSSMPGVHAA